ncbi:MAG: hypothetical protein KAH18_08095 [Psychromonas sp.]|nr:hypothetical protein [Psychromonas sp.]
MTPEEISKLHRRLHSAKGALQFFTDVRYVSSPNTKLPYQQSLPTDHHTINKYRERNVENSILQQFEDAARTGTGNCSEKASICYTNLISHPLINRDSNISICNCIGYDHTFLLLSDEFISSALPTSLSTLSNTIMIVDGWTEDCYFPNLDYFNSFRYDVISIPNPFQLFYRHKIRTYTFIKMLQPILMRPLDTKDI